MLGTEMSETLKYFSFFGGGKVRAYRVLFSIYAITGNIKAVRVYLSSLYIHKL